MLAAWIAVMLGAIVGWQYRNAAYLLPLVPALALLAAGWGPFRTPHYARWMLVALGIFGTFAAATNDAWRGVHLWLDNDPDAQALVQVVAR